VRTKVPRKKLSVGILQITALSLRVRMKRVPRTKTVVSREGLKQRVRTAATGVRREEDRVQNLIALEWMTRVKRVGGEKKKRDFLLVGLAYLHWRSVPCVCAIH
jgi:hypothetical protein